jgi:large subunit ribosomal protein L23
MSIRPRKKETLTISEDKAYETILRPIITEKATMLSEQNKVGFVVPMSATKLEIKAAVEKLYNVKVASVNTSILKGKTKRFRGVLGRRIDQKKAFVTLAEGQVIDMMQGV